MPPLGSRRQCTTCRVRYLTKYTKDNCTRHLRKSFYHSSMALEYHNYFRRTKPCFLSCCRRCSVGVDDSSRSRILLRKHVQYPRHHIQNLPLHRQRAEDARPPFISTIVCKISHDKQFFNYFAHNFRVLIRKLVLAIPLITKYIEFKDPLYYSHCPTSILKSDHSLLFKSDDRNVFR